MRSVRSGLSTLKHLDPSLKVFLRATAQLITDLVGNDPSFTSHYTFKQSATRDLPNRYLT